MRKFLIYLYVDLIVCGSMYRPVQSKANNKYPAVYTEPAIDERGMTEFVNKIEEYWVMFQ